MRISDLTIRYFDGDISLEDTLIEMEEKRKELEQELEVLKGFKSELSTEIAELAQTYKDGHKGYLFEVRNGATRYSFKGNSEWLAIDKSKKELEGKLKAMLQAKIKGASFADVNEDGEQIVLPEISYGKSTVIIKKI